MARSSRGDEDMLCFHELALGQIAAKPRMVLLEDAHVAARIQLLSADTWNEQWKLANGQIDLAALERRMKILQPDLDRSQFHSRGLAQQQFDHGWKQHNNPGAECEDP